MNRRPLTSSNNFVVKIKEKEWKILSVYFAEKLVDFMGKRV